MRTFKLAINMAGAISAGAYTAGVLDFLTEALDAWYAAKGRGDNVPKHDLSIEVFSGASAGGMCAAISAMLLQDEFQHISDASQTVTSNRLYESWVNMIDITELLKTRDLKKTPVVSLLDSTIIDQIASFALTRGTPLDKPRPYLSPDLTLFLSLTNLRGVPYSIDGVAPGSVEQSTFFYGDRIRFQTVRADSDTTKPFPLTAYKIDLTTPNADYSVLQTAAKATGAFPLFLAPRVLPRRKSDFTPPLWESLTSAISDNPPPVSPTFPKTLSDPFKTLNVDGGVTNNNPFNYAHDFLAALDPKPPEKHLDTSPATADRAVLSIAPFPTTDEYPVCYDTAANASIFKALPNLFAALISQSRFFGESLSHLMRGTTFSHFVIAPDDAELEDAARKEGKQKPPALQCATLGAFGGFFERGFRAHDYALGRRNCQMFLSQHFVLPAVNPIMSSWLDTLSEKERNSMLDKFHCDAPKDPEGKLLVFPPESNITDQTKWLPIIPLCGSAKTIVPHPGRSLLTESTLDNILDLIEARFKAVCAAMLRSVTHLPLRIFLTFGPFFIASLGRKPLKAALVEQLGDCYKQEYFEL